MDDKRSQCPQGPCHAGVTSQNGCNNPRENKYIRVRQEGNRELLQPGQPAQPAADVIEATSGPPAGQPSLECNRGAEDVIEAYIYNQTELKAMQEAKGTYSIFKITNQQPGTKKKSYYFVTGVYTDPEDVKTRIRGIAKSKAVRGGAAQVSKAMAAAGDDYEEDFTVKRIAKGMGKTEALELRNRLKQKITPKKIYNKPR